MPPLKRSLQWSAAALVAGAGLMNCACSIQPWVKPYERDRLADPIMAWDRTHLLRLPRPHPRGPRGLAGRERKRRRRVRLQLMTRASAKRILAGRR